MKKERERKERDVEGLYQLEREKKIASDQRECCRRERITK